jgi:yecA family protein
MGFEGSDMLVRDEMPEYERLEKLLGVMSSDIGASELHGVISALICAGSEQVSADWITAFFEAWHDADLLAQEAREMVGQLYYATRHLISQNEFSFMPFLPEDNQPIGARAKALSEWCEGYLYGLGLSGVTENKLTGDAKEAIQDLGHFTRLDYDELESGEATEMAYVELQEFLKVVTLLMWEELADGRGGQNANQ